MKCRQAEIHMLMRDSGELHPWRRRPLERHLAACPACRAYAAAVLSTRSALRSLPEPDCPPALRSALLDAARPDRRETIEWRPHPRGSFFWRLAFGSALLLAVVGIGWYALRPADTPPGAPPTAALLAENTDDAVDAEIEALQALLAASQNDDAGDDDLPDEETLARELLALQDATP